MDLSVFIFILLALGGFLHCYVNVPYSNRSKPVNPVINQAVIPLIVEVEEQSDDEETTFVDCYEGENIPERTQRCIDEAAAKTANLEPVVRSESKITDREAPTEGIPDTPTNPIMSYHGSHNTTNINWTLNLAPGSNLNFHPDGNLSVGNTPRSPTKKNWNSGVENTSTEIPSRKRFTLKVTKLPDLPSNFYITIRVNEPGKDGKIIKRKIISSRDAQWNQKSFSFEVRNPKEATITTKLKKTVLLGLNKSTVKKKQILLSMSHGEELDLLEDVRIVVTNIEEIIAEVPQKKEKKREKKPQKNAVLTRK